jgi:hypothetical protein
LKCAIASLLDRLSLDQLSEVGRPAGDAPAADRSLPDGGVGFRHERPVAVRGFLQDGGADVVPDLTGGLDRSEGNNRVLITTGSFTRKAEDGRAA